MRSIILLLMLIFFSACLMYAQTDTSVIMPGERIRITVQSNFELTKGYKVDENGFVFLKLLGAVKCAGLTYDAAASLISAKLEERGIMTNPITTVAKAMNQVLVVGAVAKPGIYDLMPDATLSLLLQQAVPMTEADLQNVRITDIENRIRTINATTLISGTESSDPIIQAGDTITVPKRNLAEKILILGSVTSPKALMYTEGLRLSAALIEAGGLSLDGDPANIKLIRRSTGAVSVVHYEEAETILLEPGDQVFVRQIERKAYISVKGSVSRPGWQLFYDGMTLTSAVKQALPTDKADFNKVTIIRMEPNGNKSTTVVNVNEIINGSTPDIQLKPLDIIEIKSTKHKRPRGILEGLTGAALLLLLGL